MSDLLSAASLFLAVVGLLYSVWYRELSDSIINDVPEYKDDQGPAVRDLKRVYQTRALPLAFASSVLALILFIDLISITFEAVYALMNNGILAIKAYNAVKTLFWLIAVSSALLAFHILQLTCRIRSKWKKYQ